MKKHYINAIIWLAHRPWLFWPVVLTGSLVVALVKILADIGLWVQRGIGIALGFVVFWMAMEYLTKLINPH